MERTIQEVTPTLEATSDNLKSVLEELLKQYKRQQEEMEKWKVKSGPCDDPSAQLTGGVQKKHNVQVVQQ